jgi:hypothetical protein
LSSPWKLCFVFIMLLILTHPCVTPGKQKMLALNLAIKRHGHIVSIPASYLGSPGPKIGYPERVLMGASVHTGMRW